MVHAIGEWEDVTHCIQSEGDTFSRRDTVWVIYSAWHVMEPETRHKSDKVGATFRNVPREETLNQP